MRTHALHLYDLQKREMLTKHTSLKAMKVSTTSGRFYIFEILTAGDSHYTLSDCHFVLVYLFKLQEARCIGSIT